MMENIEKNIDVENATNEHFVEVKNLRTSFFVPAGEVKSVDGISLPSRCLGISVAKGSSFFLSSSKQTALQLFLAAVASWLPYL